MIIPHCSVASKISRMRSSHTAYLSSTLQTRHGVTCMFYMHFQTRMHCTYIVKEKSRKNRRFLQLVPYSLYWSCCPLTAHSKGAIQEQAIMMRLDLHCSSAIYTCNSSVYYYITGRSARCTLKWIDFVPPLVSRVCHSLRRYEL